MIRFFLRLFGCDFKNYISIAGAVQLNKEEFFPLAEDRKTLGDVDRLVAGEKKPHKMRLGVLLFSFAHIFRPVGQVVVPPEYFIGCGTGDEFRQEALYILAQAIFVFVDNNSTGGVRRDNDYFAGADVVFFNEFVDIFG